MTDQHGAVGGRITARSGPFLFEIRRPEGLLARRLIAPGVVVAIGYLTGGPSRGTAKVVRCDAGRMELDVDIAAAAEGDVIHVIGGRAEGM